MNRSRFLDHVGWTGGGIVLSLGATGIFTSTAAAASTLSFVQISDSHIGFALPANPDVAGTFNPVAVAAAFALTSGVLLQQNAALRGALAEDGRSYDQLVQSHFVHAQFTSPAGTPIAAKAIYEAHGRWFQIVAERPADWHVALIGPGGERREVTERPPVVTPDKE